MDTTQTNLEPVNDVAKEKLPFLDGIRGFAALWVLISHCIVATGCPAPPILRSGSLPVDLFMVMSGFLMAYHYHKRQSVEPWESPGTWMKFYLRRFFRIAPLYYLLLIFSLIFNDYFAHSAQIVDTVYPNEWFAQAFGTFSNFLAHKYVGATLTNILVHITFIFGFLPQYATSTPLPDWSIGLEMQFYAVFPAMMLTFKKFSYFWATVLILGVGAVIRRIFSYAHLTPPGFSEPFPLPSFIPIKINLFIIGILLASAYYQRTKNPLLQACLIGLAILLSARNSSPIILGACILISLILFYDQVKDPLRIKALIRIPQSILANKLSTFLADTSYSVYLLHTLIMLPLAALMVSFSPYVSLPGVMRFGILFLVVVSITYGIGWLLYNYVEKPGISFGKRVIKSGLIQNIYM